MKIKRQRCPHCLLNDMAAGRSCKDEQYPPLTYNQFVSHMKKDHLVELDGSRKMWFGRSPTHDVYL